MLVDTNILIYAINLDSPKNKPAQLFLQKNIAELLVAHQNIFEALRVLTHPKFPHPMTTSNAIEAIKGITDVCRIIGPDYKTHSIALELIEKYSLSTDRVFDGYLAATAISNGISTIATDNTKDFKNFGIKLFNPFT